MRCGDLLNNTETRKKTKAAPSKDPQNIAVPRKNCILRRHLLRRKKRLNYMSLCFGALSTGEAYEFSLYFGKTHHFNSAKNFAKVTGVRNRDFVDFARSNVFFANCLHLVV